MMIEAGVSSDGGREIITLGQDIAVCTPEVSALLLDVHVLFSSLPAAQKQGPWMRGLFSEK